MIYSGKIFEKVGNIVNGNKKQSVVAAVVLASKSLV